MDFNEQARPTGIKALYINAHDILKETGQLGLRRFSCADFPGGSVVRTPRYHCRGHRFNPWLGN